MQNEVAKPQAKQNGVAKLQILQSEERKTQTKQKKVKNPQYKQNEMKKLQSKQIEVLHKLNGRYIMNAIRRLEGACGCTVVQIKKYLQNEKKLECDAGSIKSYLKNGVDAGKLSVVDRKYKVNETSKRRSSGGSPKRRRRRRSGSGKKSPGLQVHREGGVPDQDVADAAGQ